MIDFIITSVENNLILSVFFRMILAAFLGALIGSDRVKKKRPAGIKTHALVCVGATLVMLTGEHLNITYGGSTDVARLAAQVISGVGFLGAGTILVTGKNQIKGLITAAGLWFSACLGLAIGSGFYSGVFAAILVLFIIIKFFSIYDTYLHRTSYIMDLYIEYSNLINLSKILKSIHELGCSVGEIERISSKGTEESMVYITVKLPNNLTHDATINQILSVEGVNFVEEMA